MSQLSFSRTKSVDLNIGPRNHDVAFDLKLNFNEIISMRDNKPETALYSISPGKILEVIKKDKLDDLIKLTLGCQAVKNGLALWDVIFNAARRDGLIACIFIADAQYDAIDRRRVTQISNFLDTSRINSRLQSNVVEKNDRIGIGIYDVRANKTYVLLYTVAGYCMAENIGKAKNNNNTMTHAINCSLDHIYAIDAQGSAEVINVDEEVSVSPQGHSFVEWIATSVNDEYYAYPWKPHFLPAATRAFDRDQLEAYLPSAIESASEVNYDVFEDYCRDAYNEIRANRAQVTRNNAKKMDGDQQRENFKLPELEVVTLVDNRVYAKIINKSNSQGFIFAKPESGKSSITERFLLNQDLKDRILMEVSGIFLYGGNGDTPNVLRYLTANF